MTWLDVENENLMPMPMATFSSTSPSQKRKGDDGPLSPNTKRARKKVVSNMAEKVYEAD
jgi:hypothetical protein